MSITKLNLKNERKSSSVKLSQTHLIFITLTEFNQYLQQQFNIKQNQTLNRLKHNLAPYLLCRAWDFDVGTTIKDSMPLPGS